MDPTKGLFRRRPSTASTRSRLRTQASTSSASAPTGVGVSGNVVAISAQSCPTSPNHSPATRRSLGEQRIPEDEEAHLDPTTLKATATATATTTTTTTKDSDTEAAEYAAAINDAKREREQLQKSPPSRVRNPRVSSAGSRLTTSATKARVQTQEKGKSEPATASYNSGGPISLQRSASTVSGFARPYSSPGGMRSYTAGSVPSSVHGSRVDLRDTDKGSAIYLGCTAPRNSSLSLSSRGSSGSSAPPSPARTPPVSPRHGVRRSASMVKKQR